MDVGESLVASYLRYCEQCKLVLHNVHLDGEQGEVDLIGVDLRSQGSDKGTVYLCEVAVHLGGGGFHGREVEKIGGKASRALTLAETLFDADQFDFHFQFWASHLATSKIDAIEARLREFEGPGRFAHTSVVANRNFSERIEALRQEARSTIAQSNEPAFRLLQILEHLKQ